MSPRNAGMSMLEYLHILILWDIESKVLVLASFVELVSYQLKTCGFGLYGSLFVLGNI